MTASDQKRPGYLLPGEIVTFRDQKPPPHASDAELDSRYASGDVRIVTEQARYPLPQIQPMFADSDKYKRDPEYQRRHRWDAGRQSRLIESFLMNVPVPPVFLYEFELARFEVMDGRQRLTAILEFYSDEFALTELQYWPELNGRKYSELPRRVRDGIDRRYISSIILLNETAATDEKASRLKKIVFERLNSGGVELSGQESRNAIFDGPLNSMCIELSQYEAFRKTIGTPKNTPDDDTQQTEADEDLATKPGRKLFRSMGDVELVLRFFAYRQVESFPQGLNSLTDFLDEYLIRGNKFSTETLTTLGSMFKESIDFWSGTSGGEAFVIPAARQSFSKIAYDTLMYGFSVLSDSEKTALSHRGDDVKNAIAAMYSAHKDLFAGRRTNTSDVRKRNEIVLKTLQTAAS